MIYHIKIICFSAIAGIFLFLSCNKNQTTPEAEKHVIKIKIVEFGTENPIEQASISVFINPGGKKILTKTDKNGESILEATQIALRKFSKEGYWDYSFDDNQFSPVILFPGNSTVNTKTLSLIECDSFTLKLIPKSIITLHIKDSLGSSTCFNCVFMKVNGTYTDNGIINTVYDSSDIYKIKLSFALHPNIDTTINFPIFGNTVNTFNILEFDLFDDGFNRMLHQYSKYIPDKSTPVIHITY